MGESESVQVPVGLEGTVVSTREALHGALRFAGTRVYAQSLFGYVMNGQWVEEFLEDFPEVTREQADRVLEWERQRIGREFGKDMTA